MAYRKAFNRTCENPNCGKKFMGTDRARFCSDDCRGITFYYANKKAKAKKKVLSPKKNNPIVKDLNKKSTGTTQDLTQSPQKSNYTVSSSVATKNDLEKLQAELKAIPDTTKGLGKKLAESLKRKINLLKTSL